MSMFDPESYLEATLEEPSEALPPLPIGDYRAVIGNVTARQWQGKTDPTKSGIAWDVPLTVEIPAEVQAQMGADVSTLNLKDSIMLDLTEQGTIDNGMGKNGKLRRYREACDLNKPGDSFSAKKMEGKVILVKIGHEDWEGQPQARVKGVARA